MYRGLGGDLSGRCHSFTPGLAVVASGVLAFQLFLMLSGDGDGQGHGHMVAVVVTRTW